jgi:hypothetical protein
LKLEKSQKIGRFTPISWGTAKVRDFDENPGLLPYPKWGTAKVRVFEPFSEILESQ